MFIPIISKSFNSMVHIIGYENIFLDNSLSCKTTFFSIFRGYQCLSLFTYSKRKHLYFRF